jgi:hypothetical protein
MLKLLKLLQNLYNYGIRGNIHKCVQSYLTNLKQFTAIGKVSSELLAVKCGIPQGSVLGPLHVCVRERYT